MSTTETASRWDAVGLLIDQNRIDSIQQKYGLLFDVVGWLKSISIFRNMEMEKIICSSPTELDLRNHRGFLAALIGEGETLVSKANKEGWDANLLNITKEDIAATVEELYITQRAHHGDMTEARKDDILSRCFDVEEP